MARENLGNGFLHHGVATPVSNHRGTVATDDGNGRNIVLLWLFDHRGGYALLEIDAHTGQSRQIPMPFDPGGDCPFASILSSRNRYYTHFNNHFCEYDPDKGEFTFHAETVPQMTMGMTEDDNGRIWSATYPNSAVACYDPTQREFRDYGSVYGQNWRQYQRFVAADEAGWVYFAVGNTASQIVALKPDSGEALPLLQEAARGQGTAYVYRDEDGAVYGLPLAGTEDGDTWLRLYEGQAEPVGTHSKRRPKAIITASQSLFHRDFPDGEQLVECDTVDKRLVVDGVDGQRRELGFDYSSEGAHLMGLAAASDATICGGTAFPMRFFQYDPGADEWTNRASFGQWNTVRAHQDRFFVGGYTGGFLLEWDPAQPWVETTKAGGPEQNPRWWRETAQTINRPHCLRVTADGRYVLLGGTPGYGYTGGGLLIWDRQTAAGNLLEHTDMVPEQAPMSLLELADGALLVGSTVAPGTGGEQKASLAELFTVDIPSGAVIWRAPLLDDVQSYHDLYAGPEGLVFGFADGHRFFVFDPVARRLLQQGDVQQRLGTTNGQQGPRIFVRGPAEETFVLLQRGIARIYDDGAGAEPRFRLDLVAESPVPVGPGGDLLDGRIYFGSGSHLYSWEVTSS
ncbi:MAG TPA: hypothetical protein DIC52_12850 [Candidatus Latescibacteria bacterium]|nr:hypothetical protein [Candidatus Latescibacterota bacterium]